MRQARRATDGIEKILLAGLVGLVLAGAAFADHGANRRTSGSAGVSNQRSSHSQPAPLRQQPPSSLLPPAGLGSAAGAPPGFYNRNLGVPESSGPVPGPVYVPYPYPVYVLPPELAVSPSQVIAPPPQDIRRVSAYRDEVPRYRQRPRSRPQPQPVIVIQQPAAAAAPLPSPVREPAPAAPPVPRSNEPAAIRFSIAPADARVYLDDDLLGSGSELAGREAMMLRPGVYVLEVTHPDYRFQRLVFGVQAEVPLEVVVDLTAERVGRRSRIR